MIKRIGPSQLDKQYLALRPYKAVPISVNFSNLVVNKPWGSEYLMFKNLEAEIWHLSISHQRSTSMHCHPNKKTALVVIEGRALFSSLNESIELDPLDTMVIAPGTFHSTQSISASGTRVLEFETPPMKHDLLRLEDKYGRAEKGYETAERMEIDKSKIRLTSKDLGKIKDLYTKRICVKIINNPKDLASINDKKFELAIITSGSIGSKFSNEAPYLLPYAMATADLKEVGHNFNNTCVFLLGRKNGK